MKKSVRIFFPILKMWSQDVVVTIPDNSDPTEWLATELYRLIKGKSKIKPTVVSDNEFPELCDLPIQMSGAIFIEYKENFGGSANEKTS